MGISLKKGYNKQIDIDSYRYVNLLINYKLESNSKKVVN